jgi:hypothetical protein
MLACPAGFGRHRVPVRHVARVCIFDRQHHRFLGNVFPVLCTDVRSKEVRTCTARGASPAPHKLLRSWHDIACMHWVPCGRATAAEYDCCAASTSCSHPLKPAATSCATPTPTTYLHKPCATHPCTPLHLPPHMQTDWVFNAANEAIVRCGQSQPSRGGGVQKVDADKLSLYVELNVAFKLSTEDALAVPQSEYRVGGSWRMRCLVQHACEAAAVAGVMPAGGGAQPAPTCCMCSTACGRSRPGRCTCWPYVLLPHWRHVAAFRS